jgi:hypothetical protein
MTCISFGWNFGALSIYGLGDIFLWRNLSIGGGIIGCACLVASAFVVESPRWLASHFGIAEAEKSLRALRPPHTRLEGTLAEIQDNAETAARKVAAVSAGSKAEAEPPKCVPIMLAAILMGSIPLSGVFVVFNFAGGEPALPLSPQAVCRAYCVFSLCLLCSHVSLTI